MVFVLAMNSKFRFVVKFFVDANFYLSVMVLVYCGLTAVSDNYGVFDFNEDLFGAIHNNLRIALLYLALTEIVICIFVYVARRATMMLFVGYFLIMMLGSMAFYGQVNGVPVDENISLFFLYTGISHILFGWFSSLEVIKSEKNG